MRLNSLALRLFAAAALWTLIVLPITGVMLNSAFRSQIERAFDLKLDTAWWALVNLSFDSGSNTPHSPTPSAFGDPSYNTPLSGWYWQIKPVDDLSGKVLTSNSLQGDQIPFPASSPTDGAAYDKADVLGPQGERIRIYFGPITLGSGSNAKRYLYMVTGNLSENDVALARFGGTLAWSLGVLGLGLVLATWFQVRYGLRPLTSIERGLGDIRSGKALRLEGELPMEIVPLQRELNALLKSNQDIVERARTHVGNLAHALKTPLSVVMNEASGDSSPLATKVTEQAQIMRDQVQHHLDRARIVARKGTLGGVTDVEPVVSSIMRVLGKVHGERQLSFTWRCDPSVRFLGEKQDLEEMLGNLMDNACKWARSRVNLEVELGTKGQSDLPRIMNLLIEEDGPGLTASQRSEIGKRGRRLDETKPGSGLGLSIVAELADLYGGRLELRQSAFGGLAAHLQLPAA
jgi:signal transduction histidine kinase